VTISLGDESALLTELRGLSESGRHRAVVDRLGQLAPEEVAKRTSLALLAAEAHGRLGDLETADRWAAAALELAQSRGDRHAELRALNHRGAIALERGAAEDAERWFSAALERCSETPSYAAQARSLNNLGIIAHLRGDLERALASYQLALAAYQQAGLVRGMAETYHNIAISRMHLGDARGAMSAAEQAVRLAGQVQDERLATQALVGRAELHLKTRDTDFAAAELERAALVYERLQHPVGLAEVWRLQAGVARARGQVTEAVELLERAAALAGGAESAHTLAEIERDLGAALEAKGDSAGARAARERAEKLYRGLGATD
jgi:tetratricopeptide (TPR) repeat protein